MNDPIRLLLSVGEPMAAGFFEYPDGPVERTYCRAYRRYYENCKIIYKEGSPLFPTGNTSLGAYPWNRTLDTLDDEFCVAPQYAHQAAVYWEGLEKKSPEAADLFRTITKKF